MERDEPEPLPAAAQQVDDQTALVSKPRKKGGKGDLASAGFNIINSIIGSGIIGLPYSMKEAGFPLGVLLLFGVAYITDYSIILLIKGGNLSSANTYQDLVRKTYGLVGYLILSTLQFLYPFIAMISYNIITGDTLTKVFQRIPGVGTDNVLTDRHFIILLTTIIFTLPISLYRDIAKLGKVSLISLILTIVILIVVMVRTVTFSPQVPKSENAWIFAKSNAVQAVGVMSFAFICNHNSFLIYGSLEEPTLKNWSRVTHVSVSLAVIISVVFATCGYMTFTGYTEGDLFENYCRDDSLATFGRFCYGVTVILTFPLECFVTREVIANVFFHGNLSTIFHIVVTVVIIAVATGVSLVYDCLGIVLELNGVLSATPLVFIIPSACYLKLSKERWNHSDNLISCLILAVGVLVMTVGFVLTVLHPQECSHGKEMFYCVSSNISSHNSTLPPQAEHQSAD
ncbi:putative sodium-coupled neutral amino acid transporter 11 isoform X1 [Pezoporus flaviventris]|uniref:putative sodium-coupled neutral amino acid transporter 11 isoform X1 n=3 Tax=Pezoporus flaviventris TaxID=889875 RepID=UPI002AB0B10E|nr:putative sodium-coupled neutral amino acid transporter 11 isoform X1 [Pezoporus flaviventris]